MSATQKYELSMCVETIQKILSPYFTDYGKYFFKFTQEHSIYNIVCRNYTSYYN